MKKIMFLYHVKEREYRIIEMIREQILTYSKDADVRIGEFYASFASTLEFMPDVIVSIPPRDHYSSNYLTVLKLVTNAVVISMTTEGYHTFEEHVVQAMIGANTYSSKLVDYYIMWGPRTSKILGERLFETKKVADRKRIKTTGYVIYELEKAKPEPANYPEYTDILNWAGKYSGISLALTGFHVADHTLRDFYYEGYFGEQKSISEVPEEQIQSALNKVNRIRLFREKYINDIISAAEQMPDRGFLVKMHPVEMSLKLHYYDRLSEYSNIYVIDTPLPVGLLMPIIDVMIHYNSTTNMEAYIYGVPTILRFDKKESDLEILLQESTCCYDLDDRHAFIDCLKNKCEFRRLPMLEKKLYRLFNWRSNKPYKPLEKIARYVFEAKKSQYLSCFDREVMKAVTSKEGREIEKLLFFKTLKGEIGFKALCGLAKFQVIKVIDKLEGLKV